MEPIKLSPEMKTKLLNMEEEITAVKAELAKAKKVGINVSTLENRLEKALQLRKLILENYG